MNVTKQVRQTSGSVSILEGAVLVSVLIALLAVCVAWQSDDSSADVYRSGVTGDCEWSLTDTGVLSVSPLHEYGAMEDYDDVTTPWSSDKWLVKNVVIKDGVTTVGKNAFCGCTSLSSVTIGDSVTTVGMYAFRDCSRLTSVEFGSSVQEIAKMAFRGCTSLKTVTIPDSVTTLRSSTFFSCTSLESVKIGNSVTSVDKFAFSECTSLKYVTIGSSVTSVNSEAFSGCTSLQSVTLPDSVSFVSGDAFLGCTALTSFTMGRSLTSLESELLSGCTALTSLTIGSFVKTIGSSAFYGCTALKTVVIPDSVRYIEENAFRMCSNLTWVVLGNHVQTLGTGAFSDCPSLKSVEFPSSLTDKGDSFSLCLFYSATGTRLSDTYALAGCLFHSAEPGSLTKVKSHTTGPVMKENESATGYDEVTYCTVCGMELSRTYTPASESYVIEESTEEIKVTVIGNPIISQADVEKLVAAANADHTKTLDVSYNDSLIHLDNTAVRNIDTSKEIKVVVDRSDNIVPHSVGTSTQYEICLGDNHIFNGGKLTITVPYDGSREDLKVYYLSDGEIKEVITCSYSDGNVTFSVGHLSTFVIVRSEQCTVTFQDWDNTVVSSETCSYGDRISAPLMTPTRDSDGSCSYTFAGWNGYTSGMTASSDKYTFTAAYDVTPIKPINNGPSSPGTSGSSDDGMSVIAMVVVAFVALAVVGGIFMYSRSRRY